MSYALALRLTETQRNEARRLAAAMDHLCSVAKTHGSFPDEKRSLFEQVKQHAIDTTSKMMGDYPDEFYKFGAALVEEMRVMRAARAQHFKNQFHRAYVEKAKKWSDGIANAHIA